MQQWPVVALLAYLAPATSALQVQAGKEQLTRALTSTTRPIIVHLADDHPEALSTLDVEEISLRCRMAGAAALLVQPELLDAVAVEQATAKGDFPGPLPLICMLESAEMAASTDLTALSSACAVGVRCESGEQGDMLDSLVAGADAAGMGTLVIAGDAAAQRAAVGAGTSVVAISGWSATDDESAATDGVTLEAGRWDGTDEELQRLRDAGFAALLLDDPCRGDVAGGLRRASPSCPA